MCNLVRFGATSGALLLAVSAAPAIAAQVYFNDFQGLVGSEWSQDLIASAPNPDYAGNRKFLGEFGNDSVSLTLDALPAHDTVTVDLSLYLIRSWDGSDGVSIVNGDHLGEDHWTFDADGATIFDETFSNGNQAGQTYSPAPGTPSCNAGFNAVFAPGLHNPMTGAVECYSLGYTFTFPPDYSDPEKAGKAEYMDAVYNLSFVFAHTDGSLKLDFGAFGLQSLADESWGLDDVRVSVVEAVPLPAAWPLLLGGLATIFGIGRYSRR